MVATAKISEASNLTENDETSIKLFLLQLSGILCKKTYVSTIIC